MIITLCILMMAINAKVGVLYSLMTMAYIIGEYLLEKIFKLEEESSFVVLLMITFIVAYLNWHRIIYYIRSM